MSLDERRSALRESIRILATHEPFLRFMEEIERMREAALRDACRNDVVENLGRVAASLGEIRCYTDIKDMVADFSSKSLD
jgi:hypothetical protein